MNFVKNMLLKIINKNVKIKSFITVGYKRYRYDRSFLGLLSYFIKGVFFFYHPSLKSSRGSQMGKILSKSKIKIEKDKRFIFSIDYYKILTTNKKVYDNTTVDYSIILENSIDDFKKKICRLKPCDFKDDLLSIVTGITSAVDNTIKQLKKSNKINKKELINYFENMKTKKAQGFEEALQRILFFNQILWQTGHELNGFGKLDNILYKYYKNDVSKNIIDCKTAKNLLKDFIKSVHSYYWFKSSVLLGDTGQIIVLGGETRNNNFFCNELTYDFIDAIRELQLPDPKILLRVSKKVPNDLLETSLKCISTGIGCPLFANDDIIIKKLIDFGYDKADAYNYVTSACWEPLIPRKSVEQNNVSSFVFMDPFLKIFESENLNEIMSFDSLVELYLEYLGNYTKGVINNIRQNIYDKDPLMSLFIPNCIRLCKDISENGAIYNNYGVTSVSLGNVVNSLMNINYYVFETKKYTLCELDKFRRNNYRGCDDLVDELKNQPCRYGKQNKNVVYLSNMIISKVNYIIQKNPIKKKSFLKFGLSSPSYIMDANNTDASFDGRRKGEPFGVHISSDIPMLSYTELVGFSSKLEYGKFGFNGNVVDFMVTPSFIIDNFEKFKDFLFLSISVGYFEMQMNVISSEMLINAKKNPELYRNLIVRVWGFSAYFNDLPDEYKDILIERALINEGKSY